MYHDLILAFCFFCLGGATVVAMVLFGSERKSARKIKMLAIERLMDIDERQASTAEKLMEKAKYLMSLEDELSEREQVVKQAEEKWGPRMRELSTWEKELKNRESAVLQAEAEVQREFQIWHARN